jgi:hypothetical protein
VEDEVGQHCQVGDEKAYAERGDAVGELENLKRQEGCGDESGEVFSPDFFEHEADTLEQAERCVAEEEEADFAQHGVVDEAGLMEDQANEVTFGVSMQGEDDLGDDLSYVFMQQLESADSYADQQQSLEQLIGGDEFQPPITQFRISRQIDPPCAPETIVNPQ